MGYSGVRTGLTLRTKTGFQTRERYNGVSLLRRAAELTTRHFGVLKRFTPEELAASCNDFSDDNYLGEGGFSIVYKGTLENGTTVAIKKMKVRTVLFCTVLAQCLFIKDYNVTAVLCSAMSLYPGNTVR